MLDGRAHALALYALDIGGGSAGCEKRILAKVLEISATQGGAINVHSRAKHEVDAAGACILADDRTHAPGQIRIPRRRQTDAAGKVVEGP